MAIYSINVLFLCSGIGGLKFGIRLAESACAADHKPRSNGLPLEFIVYKIVEVEACARSLDLIGKYKFSSTYTYCTNNA